MSDPSEPSSASPSDRNHLPDHDTLPPSQDPIGSHEVREPPTTTFGRLAQIGPGLIIAASIVGSGELIATTKTGAQAGITLLWLIIIGCMIKTFVQIEFGRYTISHGETTLAALDRVPGPKFRVGWIVWFWLLMTLAGVGQLGSIVGGVGQALALTVPITGDYEREIAIPSEKRLTAYLDWEQAIEENSERWTSLPDEDRQQRLDRQAAIEAKLEPLGETGTEVLDTLKAGGTRAEPWTWDDRLWAAVIAVFTAWLLYHGRYQLLQRVSLILVGGFTLITVANVVALQLHPDYGIPVKEILHGLSFRLPPATETITPLATALATFGLIGVGAAELISYPYWCLEKGYAKYTGPRDDSEAWAERARGWIRIMKLDAFASMILFTIATVMFFLMGVAVLHRDGLDPEGMRMVATLAEAYVPIFGDLARWLFLIGAVAVLYSTYMAANAANTRMFTDGLKLLGVIDRHDETVHRRWVGRFAIILPLLCAVIYWIIASPVKLILISGMMQVSMLPPLAFAALWFRYRRSDVRLRSGRAWDVFLILSCAGLVTAGVWGIIVKVQSLF